MTPPRDAEPLGLVVLISGNGTNLQAILDAIARGEINAEVRAVISNRPGARGLERARLAGVPTQVLDHKTFADRAAYDAALQRVIDDYRPGLIVLAGYMRILTPEFVRHYRGRMLNIHPSLLPEFTGLDTHRRALAAGTPEHGASVHFVTEELDGGPVIVQAPVPVEAGDDAATLAARVQTVEHRIYPLAIRWFADGRVHMENDRVWLDNEPLKSPVRA